MKKRLRPITYAESLEAKRLAEEQDFKIGEEEPKREEIKQEVTTLNSVEVKTLPSGGGAYPKNSEIYFTPLSFGEMKFISGSTLGDYETIKFFLNKIQCSFPKEDLTYHDFYFITVLIKMATFGEMEYDVSFECNSCGFLNKQKFTSEEIAFEEVKVSLPVRVDLKTPFIDKNGETHEFIDFRPISVGRFLDMIDSEELEDEDVYMSNCIIGFTKEERIKLIKEYLIGCDTQILESIDVYMYHGVEDLHFKCRNKLKPKDMTEEEFKNKKDNGEVVGEVCGRVHDIPFRYLPEYITPTDKCKESLGERVHFGV